jgi:hypothetical protein
MLFCFELIRRTKRGATDMADNDKTAFIRSVREENSVKYIAKVFNQPPAQITKAQYNQIVKALREQDWRNNDEDEQSVISRIISRSLTVEPDESDEV